MSPTAGTGTSLRLSGVRLSVARGGCILLSLAAILLFFLGIPPFYNELVQGMSEETLSALQSLGMSVTFYATYQTALDILLLIGCMIAGGILLWFKSDEWVALLVVFTLIGTGANAFSPLFLSSTVIGSPIPVFFVMAAILASQPLTCYVLPDGNFLQKWMKVAAAVWLGWLMISVFWPAFPLNLFNWEGNGFTIYLFAELAALLSGIYALIYRYFHTGSPVSFLHSQNRRKESYWVLIELQMKN